MSLAELKYIEKALSTLTKQQKQLEMISKLLRIEFAEIMELHAAEYLNISARVKGEESLKEKILRRGYYKKYNDPQRLIYKLSDLIGIRIECRFQQDEYAIYDLLKKHFNQRNTQGYYYNETNPNVKLSLDGRQPERQKNGFKIFRIDGVITDTDTDLPFELQIKCLVNSFWSEVEHKIIYKNYSFLMMDELLTEMLHSIKNNLALLDKQLLSIYQNVEQMKAPNEDMQQKALKDVMTRLCNDVFARKLKEQMGFNVNIKKAIQTLIHYTFLVDEPSDFESLIVILKQISELAHRDIQFNVPIPLEHPPHYNTPFSKCLGPYFIEVMNKEFHWNLFFKMLMEIESQTNVKTFEKFLTFLEQAYQNTPSFLQLKELLFAQLGDDANLVLDDLMLAVAYTLVEIDDIKCIYEGGLLQVNLSLTELLIKSSPHSYECWLLERETLLRALRDKIISSM